MLANGRPTLQSFSSFKTKRKNILNKVISYSAYRLRKQANSIIESNLSPKYHQKIFTRFRLTVFGFAVISVALALFVYTFYTNFMNFYKYNTFVSTDLSAGKCESVPRVLTLDTKADYDGHWDGSDSYVDSIGLYNLNVANLRCSQSQYASMMSNIDAALLVAAKKMASTGLAVNLVYYAVWTFVQDVDGYSQTFATVADAYNIFNPELNLAATYASERGGDCPILYVNPSYDLTLGDMSMTLDIDMISQHPSCNSSLNFVPMGYYPSYSNSMFSIHISAQTLMSVLAVNLGIMTLGYFTRIDKFVSPFKFAGTSYRIDRYYDSMYPTMDPMFCIGSSNSTSLDGWKCVMKIGSVYMLPYIQHIGSGGFAFPKACVCDGKAVPDICNEQHIIAGVILYDHTLNSSSTSRYSADVLPIIPMLELFDRIKGDFYAFNEALHKAAWTAFPGQISTNATYEQAAWRSNAYKMTRTPTFGTASLMEWYFESVHDTSISQNKFQLKNGACSTTIRSPNFHLLYENGNSYSILDESYYRCTMTVYGALNNALGITVGFVGSITPIPFLIFIYFLKMYLASKPKLGRSDNVASNEQLAAEEDRCKEEAGVSDISVDHETVTRSKDTSRYHQEDNDTRPSGGVTHLGREQWMMKFRAQDREMAQLQERRAWMETRVLALTHSTRKDRMKDLEAEIASLASQVERLLHEKYGSDV